MRKYPFHLARLLAVMALLLVLAACTPGSGSRSEADAALIRAPAVGDVYAADLTYFSEASFEDQPRVYGLLKVIAVDAGKITVITESAASDSEAAARKDLLGSLEDIDFDATERIEIVDAQLEKAYESGKIFAVRR